jgi:hypothetical protein
MSLSGRVAIVPVGEAATARTRDMVERLTAEGARVVLVTGEHTGEESRRRLNAEIGRLATAGAAVFHLGPDPGLDALVEFLGEMFRAP